MKKLAVLLALAPFTAFADGWDKQDGAEEMDVAGLEEMASNPWTAAPGVDFEGHFEVGEDGKLK